MEQHRRRREGSAARSGRPGGARGGERRSRPRLEGLESRRLLSITEYPLATPYVPEAVTTGSDGRGGQEIWFTDTSYSPGHLIGMSTSGQIDRTVAVGHDPGSGGAIAAAPNGTIWFAEFDPINGVGSVGRIDASNPAPTAGYTSVALPTGTQVGGIAYDPDDGRIWIVEGSSITAADNAIAWINPASFATSADIHVAGLLPAASEGTKPVPSGLVYNPVDHALWFGNSATHSLGMYDPIHGTFNTTTLTLPTSGAEPLAVAVDSSGTIWYLQTGTSPIGSYRPGTGFGPTYPLPGVGPDFSVNGITNGPDGRIYFTLGGSGPSEVGWFNPATIASTNDIHLANPAPTSGSGPFGITTGPDGNIWFTEQQGLQSGPDANNGALAVLPLATQLDVSTPVGVVAGKAFNLTVTDVYQDATGFVDKSFNGDVTIRLASGPGTLGGTLTARAVNGVATFSGLTIGTTGSYTIQADGSSATGQTRSFAVSPTPTSPTPTSPTPTSPTPTSPTPTPTPPTPTVTGEQIVPYYQRYNRKGRGIGRPLEAIVLTFSAPMDSATLANPGNYRLNATTFRGHGRHRRMILRPLAVLAATPGADGTSVTLKTSANQKKLAGGGQLEIVSPHSVISVGGAGLGGPTAFAIARRGHGIAPSL